MAGLAANVAGGAAIGAGVGAFSYALDRGIEYLQTGTFEWDWGEFGLSVGIGAAAGAAGGYLRWRSLQKPTATPVKGGGTAKPTNTPGTTSGSFDDVVRTGNQLQEIAEQVADDFDNGLLGRPPGGQPSAAGRGNVIHAEVALRAQQRGLPVVYNRIGPDFEYVVNGARQGIFFELTTPGQVGRHISRFANQGYLDDIFFFILY